MHVCLVDIFWFFFLGNFLRGCCQAWLEILLDLLHLLFFVGKDVLVFCLFFYFLFLCFKRFLKQMKDKGF